MGKLYNAQSCHRHTSQLEFWPYCQPFLPVSPGISNPLASQFSKRLLLFFKDSYHFVNDWHFSSHHSHCCSCSNSCDQHHCDHHTWCFSCHEVTSTLLDIMISCTTWSDHMGKPDDDNHCCPYQKAKKRSLPFLLPSGSNSKSKGLNHQLWLANQDECPDHPANYVTYTPYEKKSWRF